MNMSGGMTRKNAVGPVQTNWYVSPTDEKTKKYFLGLLPAENHIGMTKCSDGEKHDLFLCVSQQVLRF
ncbi:MAG: hypothetical protein NTY04_02150 [Candidatus Staskawiczbacteria bacterium]|nr:hypothetical protein [Candidatus Staskawiczbacteria bacterium]